MNRREFVKRSVLAGAAANVLHAGGAEAIPPGDRIAVGVIGTGARAQQLMEASTAIPGIELVALADAYTGRAARAKARTGGRAAIHDDYQEILARRDIDAVMIATPDHWHKTMAVEALAAGKDVYLEKPMTYAVAEGLEVIAAVRKTGRVLQVGSQGISSAADAKARELVQSGRLGQVTMIRATYNRNTAGGAWLYPIPPDASPATVRWEQFLGPAPKRPFSLERFFRWRCYWDYSGGISTDLFVHLLTSIHHVMNARMPRTVVATGELYRWKDSREVPDTVNAILTYPEGFTVNLSSTFNNEASSESGFDILGTEGSLSMRGDALTLTPEAVQEDNRWVVSSWPQALEKAYYADPVVQARETPAGWAPTLKTGRAVWHERGRDATVSHLANFYDAVRTRAQPIETAEIGHHAASAAHMVNLSLRQKKAVAWDAAGDSVESR